MRDCHVVCWIADDGVRRPWGLICFWRKGTVVRFAYALVIHVIAMQWNVPGVVTP